MEIVGRFVETSFFGNGSRVDDEDYAMEMCGIYEPRGRKVAQFAVAGGVVDEEAAGAFVGRIACGAVTCRVWGMGFWEEGGNGEGRRRRVSRTGGAAVQLRRKAVSIR